MTTKYKIISGFLFMMFLLGGIASLGYDNLQKSSDGFLEYQRVSGLNAYVNDMRSSLFEASYEATRFVDMKDARHAESARAAVDAALETIRQSNKLVREPERASVLRMMENQAADFRSSLGLLQNNILAAFKQYSSTIHPSVEMMAGDLTGMTHLAQRAENAKALIGISNVWQDLSSAQSSLTLFAESFATQDAANAQKNINNLTRSLEELGMTLSTPEGHALYASMLQSFTKVTDSFVVMSAQNKAAEQNLNEMNARLQAMLKAAKELNTSVEKQMTAYGQNLLQNNSSSQRQMLLVSSAGILLGLIIAGLIVFGFIKVLNNLAGFASATAKGDFAYKLRVHEKGEIGAMVQSMAQLPVVFEQVVEQAKILANDIASGKFRNRLQKDSFTGAFAGLAQAVNTVSDAYTKVMDELPVPVMTCNKKNEILFLNAIAQTALGGNHTNSQCSRHLKAAECNGDKCFGMRAMSQNSPYSGETSIHPQGRRMDISVTALPMHDLQDNVVGYAEIITDLTEVKSKQFIVQQVAQDALEISSRVATASEQLAAQIEQISGGTMVQRKRLEGTASAMTEMNATVLEVARSAGQASEQSDGTRKQAEAGSSLVNQVVKSINVVNDVAVHLQNNMQELGKQAESIGGVMNVISDIADQTNLLALNAAIEAARAGEAGRGFAVVADEVRKLAEKTMNATHEVGSNIEAIQNSARTNIHEVSNAVKSITDATELANSSGTALQEIVHLASENSLVVASIAAAAEEQSATSEEINHSIEEINQVVGETSEGMMRSTVAVQDLSRMSQELRSIMDKLK